MKQWTCFYLLGALTVLLAGPGRLTSAEPPRPAPEVDELFDRPRVLPLKIEIPGPSLEELKKEPKKYVKANVREGDKTYAEVGIRMKGSGSFQSIEKKPSLSIKFNEFVTGALFHGHSRILLDSSAPDPSYLMAAIGGEIFRAANVPAPKISFAQVELNGQNLGLYVLEQAVNRDFLSEYFQKTKGNLYEGDNADVNEKLDRDGGEKSQEQPDLRALASAAREGDPATRLKKLSGVLDLDRFISLAAVDVFTWNQSGYTLGRNNYRVYHDPNSNLMVFIPHGLDELFGKTGGALMPEWKGLVAKAVFETQEGQRRYREQMARLLGTAFKPEPQQAKINELSGKIRPIVTRDANAVKAFDTATAQLRERIAERARYIDQQLKTQPAK